jgi:cytochrome c2
VPIDRLALAALAALALVACDGSPAHEPEAPDVETAAPEVALEGDAARGRELIAHYQCNRCHEGTGLDEPDDELHCVRCHRQIREGSFDAPAASLRRWQRNLHRINAVPSLRDTRLRADWMARFLQDPIDVRPALEATMPRLGLSAEEAADIAAALSRSAPDEGDAPSAPTGAQVEEGRALLVSEGCFGCHSFGGLEDAAGRAQPRAVDDDAHLLAPDLRHTRERWTRRDLETWLEDPGAMRPGTSMPTLALSSSQIARLVDVLTSAPLAPSAPVAVPERLPLLDRPVRYAEVEGRVLLDTCWHCHSDPDYAHGDGGPGNTGGFGFEGRGARLSDYEGVSSGYDVDGERRSLFAPDADGTPHLVRVLMARHSEVAGQPIAGVTGMPLGLPPIPLEDIQLVESWIAQGRPR